jgi:hypothetical protein
MAAIMATLNHKKIKTPAHIDSTDTFIESKPPIIPPEREWESNAELGMLMLNG